MKLSIIIVNYNVEFFLEQCLHAVRKATKKISSEVFVVDNSSVDGSVAMVREKFPEVILIANQDNVGFSRANNQAIREAKGEYILLLNPDTVVEEDTFDKCVAFMDKTPDAGGLGVKMVNGKGRFLPESKRGLPTPAVAFYKIFGLSKLFPKSKTFGSYHLSYLDENKTHSVEILAGAFMMLRKSVTDKIGVLDEDFFMYGEDIDLSWRIVLAGYKNYYFPETRIIHYKGESTRKSSVNYVIVFYNAMLIFARKHFNGQQAGILTLLIKLAIYFRAGLSLLRRVFEKLLLPATDGVIMYAGMKIISLYWETLKFGDGFHYPDAFTFIVLPAYTLIWITSIYLSGGYDKPVRLLRILQGIITGTIFILVVYGLLDESVRFSRAVIIFGSLWGITAVLASRLILHYSAGKQFRLATDENKRYLVIGKQEEATRVADLLRRTHPGAGFIGLVTPLSEVTEGHGFIGTMRQLADIIPIYSINELVFCGQDIPARTIIDLMSNLKQKDLDYKIAPPESVSIIGSNSISTLSDPFILDINPVGKSRNRRNKRLTDLLICLFMAPVAPIIFLISSRPIGFLTNYFAVLFGIKTWVGFSKGQNSVKLPAIKNGILTPADAFNQKKLEQDTIDNLNLLYARNYNPITDLNILINSIRSLGRKS